MTTIIDKCTCGFVVYLFEHLTKQQNNQTTKHISLFGKTVLPVIFVSKSMATIYF